MGQTWESLLRDLLGERDRVLRLNQEHPAVLKQRLDHFDYILQTILEKLRDAENQGG